jgi:hypothetical protein
MRETMSRAPPVQLGDGLNIRSEIQPPQRDRERVLRQVFKFLRQTREPKNKFHNPCQRLQSMDVRPEISRVKMWIRLRRFQTGTSCHFITRNTEADEALSIPGEETPGEEVLEVLEIQIQEVSTLGVTVHQEDPSLKMYVRKGEGKSVRACTNADNPAKSRSIQGILTSSGIRTTRTSLVLQKETVLPTRGVLRCISIRQIRLLFNHRTMVLRWTLLSAFILHQGLAEVVLFPIVGLSFPNPGQTFLRCREPEV